MIPDFDHNGVLPPHLGNPAGDPRQMSPYPTDTLELCKKFATSPERIKILDGFLAFRAGMRKIGIKGFHWIDGSFLEDIENVGRKRPPSDLDMLTFFVPLTPAQTDAVFATFLEFPDRNLCKNKFKLDNINLNLSKEPYVVIEFVSYYTQLFTHNRDKVWKGMLKLNFGVTPDEDDEALKYLKTL